MHLLLERNLYKNHYVCPFSGISQNREKIKEFILYKCALRAKLFFPNQIYCCFFFTGLVVFTVSLVLLDFNFL